MKLSQGKTRFAVGTSAGLTLAVVAVLFAFGVPEGQGCGGSAELLADASDADNLTATVCPQQHSGKSHDGESVIFCDQAFPVAPRVRPPADVPGKSMVMALATGGRIAFLVDRSGVEYAVVDAKGQETGTLPSTVHAPSNRNLYTLYQVAGTIGTYTDSVSKEKMPSIHPSSMKPYILLTQAAIDGSVPVFEGTVTKRVSDSRWDWKDTVPIRVAIHSQGKAPRDIPIWGEPLKTLPDGKVQALEGAIENWDKPVKGSDGKCYPALAPMAKSSPFAGAKSGSLSLYRMATMHFPGDQVMVIEYPQGTTGLSMNGMGGLTVLHPAAFLQTGKDPQWHVQQFHPHAEPNGNVIELHPVSGGGGGC